MQEGGPEESQFCGAVKPQGGLLDHEPAGGVTLGHLQDVLVCQDADEKQHQGGGHQVQRCAADGLVCLQIHGCEAQQQGKQCAHQRCHQHGQQLKALQRHPVPRLLGGGEGPGLLHIADKIHAHKRTEDHNAFQRQVDDAAALGKHAGQCHDHQRNGIDQGLLYQKRHASSPPFLSPPSEGPGSGFGFVSAAAGTARRFFRPPSNMRITREKALR